MLTLSPAWPGRCFFANHDVCLGTVVFVLLLSHPHEASTTLDTTRLQAKDYACTFAECLTVANCYQGPSVAVKEDRSHICYELLLRMDHNLASLASNDSHVLACHGQLA